MILVIVSSAAVRVLDSFSIDAEIEACEEYETENLLRLPDTVALIENAVVELGVSEDVIRLTRNTTA